MKEKILLVAVGILSILSGFLFANQSQFEVKLSAVTTESTLFYRSDISSTTNVTITVNAQIFATSTTGMIYRRIVNNCSSIVFVQDASDIAASLTSGFALAANGGVWDSNNENFIYTGAVNASSTDEISCDLHTIEY